MNAGAAALIYAGWGWRVFPLAEGSKLPKIAKGNGGHGLHDATTGTDQLRAWWSRWPNANVGVRTGDGLVVLDVDAHHGGEETLRELTSKHGPLPPTLWSRTPSGGRHYWMRSSEPLRCSAGQLGPGLDVRAQGGYIVGPPSTVGGRSYTWGDLSLPIRPLPSWLLRKLRKPERRRGTVEVPAAAAEGIAASMLRQRAQQVADAAEGSRNNVLNVAAYVMGFVVGIIDEAVVRTTLFDAALSAGLGHDEAVGTIDSGLAAGMTKRGTA